MQLTVPVRREDGFTLVELLVVIVILGVVGSVVTSSLIQGMQTTRRAQDRMQALAEMERAAERVSRELRAACPVTDVHPDEPDPATPDGDEGHYAQVEVLRGGQRLRFTYQLPVGGTTLNVTREHFDTSTSSWVQDFSQPVIGDLTNRTGASPVDTFQALDQGGAETTIGQQVMTFELTLRRDLPEEDPITVDHAVHVRNGGHPCGD